MHSKIQALINSYEVHNISLILLNEFENKQPEDQWQCIITVLSSWAKSIGVTPINQRHKATVDYLEDILSLLYLIKDKLSSTESPAASSTVPRPATHPHQATTTTVAPSSATDRPIAAGHRSTTSSTAQLYVPNLQRESEKLATILELLESFPEANKSKSS